MPPITIDPEYDTICDVIRRWAEIQPDAPALVAEGQDTLTYGELSSLMDRFQQRLNGMGYGRQDRIAIIAPNGPAMAALVTGIWGCATAVPLNPALTVGEFAIYMRDLKVCAIAVDAEMDTAARAAAQEIGLPVLEVDRVDRGVAGMVDIRLTPSPGKTARPGMAQLDDLAMVLTTSGTTSHSKVVPISHRQLSIKVDRNARSFELTAADRCLNLMPLFHAGALYTGLGATFFSGGSLITLPEFSVDGFFRLLETLAPTWYMGSYTFHHAICAAVASHTAAIEKSRLRFVRAASGHLDPRIADELGVILRAPVIETYATTETGFICSNPLPPVIRKPGTVGLPVGSEVAIIGPDKQFLAPGERGEVVVNTADIFTGYENDPAANAEYFFDGWFLTGDEGVFDEDGYLTLTGRIKEMINRGGEKVSPAEVDAVLMTHPKVSEAATFPIPHPTLGEEVAVAVVQAPGARLTDQELTKFLLQKLAGFKIPRRFFFIDKIPKSAAGKVQRYKLAEALDVGGNIASAAGAPADRQPTPVETRLREIWAKALRVPKVGLDDNFFLLGGDSLQAVQLFLEIENAFGRRLPAACLFEAGTVSEMAELIERGEAQGCMVPIQPYGTKPPFFCVHGNGGQVISYSAIARHLGSDQPFYGIQSIGWDGHTVPFTKTADMAAHYIAEMRKVQPHGPYYLGGYSYGGRVAVYMAKMLKDGGDEVGLLALIEPFSLRWPGQLKLRNWLAYKEASGSVDVVYLTARFAWFKVRDAYYEHLYLPLARAVLFPVLNFYRNSQRTLPRILRRPDRANGLMQTEQRKMLDYPGDAIYFQSRSRRVPRQEPERDSWSHLIKGNLAVVPMPCNHLQMMREPFVASLAQELRTALDGAQAEAHRADRKKHRTPR